MSCTVELTGKLAAQVGGQTRPAGELATVPAPCTTTVTCGEAGAGMKVATTWVEAPSASVQGCSSAAGDASHEARTSASCHPASSEPAAAWATSVTWLLSSNDAEHVPGHEMPAGVLSTVPCPVPASATCSSRPARKVAVTVPEARALIVQVSGAGPLSGLHASGTMPLQPANVDPWSADAVSVIGWR
jgi:hypothetical protein